MISVFFMFLPASYEDDSNSMPAIDEKDVVVLKKSNFRIIVVALGFQIR